MGEQRRIGVFDLDGTLLDSDAALAEPFLALGVPSEAVTFGHVIADECARLGLKLDDYLGRYDTGAAHPFEGVLELMAGLERWAVCSNKHPRLGHAELERLGWSPEVALFADAFEGPKQLRPVLAALRIDPSEAIFVGDTAHDRQCAFEVGCPFVLAGWNSRARSAQGDLIANTPIDVAKILAA